MGCSFITWSLLGPTLQFSAVSSNHIVVIFGIPNESKTMKISRRCICSNIVIMMLIWLLPLLPAGGCISVWIFGSIVIEVWVMTKACNSVMATTTLQKMTSTLQPILSIIKSSQLYKLMNNYGVASCAIFSFGYLISRYFSINAYRKLKQYPPGPGKTYAYITKNISHF